MGCKSGPVGKLRRKLKQQASTCSSDLPNKRTPSKEQKVTDKKTESSDNSDGRVPILADLGRNSPAHIPLAPSYLPPHHNSTKHPSKPSNTQGRIAQG